MIKVQALKFFLILNETPILQRLMADKATD